MKELKKLIDEYQNGSQKEKEIIQEFCVNRNKEKKLEVGSRIVIIDMKKESSYIGKKGAVLSIDDIGQLHGTWGGCAIIPGVDVFLLL